jgi:hypothetical protein
MMKKTGANSDSNRVVSLSASRGGEGWGEEANTLTIAGRFMQRVSLAYSARAPGT